MLSFPKNTPTICLILHQFNLYVPLICGKKLVTIENSLGDQNSGKGPIFKASNQS